MSRMILTCHRREERQCGKIWPAGTLVLITWGFILLQCSTGWCVNVPPPDVGPRQFRPVPGALARRVAVPDLRGMTLAGAKSALASTRLQVGKVVRRIDNRPAGTVVDQRPAPRTLVLPGAKVNLAIAVPAVVNREITVPDLRGQTEAQARNTLERARLQVGAESKKTDNRPPGTVIDQRPGAGAMVLPGTKVDLRIAVPAKTAVPDLRGQTEAQARNTLERARLQVGAESKRTDNRPPGTVIDQRPVPRTLVLPGAKVDLWFAEALRKVLVPDLAGLTLKQARDTLSRAGLLPGRISEQPSDRPDQTVIRQIPPSGTRVGADTAVDLVLSAQQTVTVPNLLNRNRRDAEDLLKKARLSPGHISMEVSSIRPGIVIRQSPAAETRKPVGSPVDFVVSQEIPGKPPYKWIAVIGGLLAILGGGYLGVKRTVRRNRWLQSVRLRPEPDKGAQQLVLGAPLHLDWEVRLKPVKDPGQQTIESPEGLELEERRKS